MKGLQNGEKQRCPNKLGNFKENKKKIGTSFFFRRKAMRLLLMVVENYIIKYL